MGIDLPSRYVSRWDNDHGSLAYTVTADAMKTRVQTWDLISATQTSQRRLEAEPLLSSRSVAVGKRPSTYRIAKDAYSAEGVGVFFRGLGICSARAFFVNAVQWAVSRQSSHIDHNADKKKGIRMDDETTNSLNCYLIATTYQKQFFRVASKS